MIEKEEEEEVGLMLSCQHQWTEQKHTPVGLIALETRERLTNTVFTHKHLDCAEGSRALGWKHRFSTDCKTEDHSGGEGGGEERERHEIKKERGTEKVNKSIKR